MSRVKESKAAIITAPTTLSRAHGKRQWTTAWSESSSIFHVNCTVVLLKTVTSATSGSQLEEQAPMKFADSACAISSSQSPDCTSVLHILEIVQDLRNFLRNLEIGTQFPDSENAQHNLKIAQIPKLHGTYSYMYMQYWLIVSD